jgi:uncharacterized membrane protein YjjB (DUF3815 family)
MDSFWRKITAVTGENSFAWTMLFVVCFAYILAFIFEAPIDIVVPVIALGGLAAVAEHVMHARHNQ